MLLLAILIVKNKQNITIHIYVKMKKIIEMTLFTPNPGIQLAIFVVHLFYEISKTLYIAYKVLNLNLQALEVPLTSNVDNNNKNSEDKSLSDCRINQA
jgi:hypothetical protein